MPSRKDQLLRHLSILRKIQVNPHLTAQDLAVELEVSTRTVFRDIKALSESNFPIYYDEGYRLPEKYFFPQVNFDVEELVALFISSSFLKRQRELPYYRSIKRALEKIEASLQPEYRKILGDLGSQFAVGISEGVYEEASFRVMELINNAILDRRRLNIRYHTYTTDAITTRSVDPYGVFFSQDNWYLVAYCHLRHAIREFNIKRIREASITDEKFNLPPGFKISHYLVHNWDFGEADQITVSLWHSAADSRWIREVQWHPTQKIEDQKDGSMILTVSVRAPENMIPWILSRKSEIAVLSPGYLKNAVADEIEKMAFRCREGPPQSEGPAQCERVGS
ncbi:MAG: helix-turn-helix transcriptional regulator [Vulcanimicrobiota bacterium]